MARPPAKQQKQPKNSVSPANSSVTPKGNEEKSKSVTHQIQHSSFSGPIPHPTILEGYERLVPGAADRILLMAEADAEHQRKIEFAALCGIKHKLAQMPAYA